MKPLFIIPFLWLFFAHKAAAVIEITRVTHNYSEPPDTDCSAGSIDLTAEGNAGPFSFAWSNGATTEDLIDLCKGTYSVTVTNKFGCTKVLSAQIKDCRYDGTPADIAISNFKITTLSAVGASDGAIDITVTGGFPVKYYKWTRQGSPDVIATTEDISGLSEGVYCVAITGDCGIGTTACYSIRHCPSLVWTINPSIKPECICGSDCWFCDDNCRKGSITLTITAPTGPKTYRWSNGANGNPVKDLRAGTYTVTITDVNSSCSTTRSFTISQKEVKVEYLGNCFWRALCGEDVIDWYQGEVHRELETRIHNGVERCVQQQYCDDTPVEGKYDFVEGPIKEIDFDRCKGVKKCKNGVEEVVVGTATGERTVSDEDQNCEARISCKITWPDGTISDTTSTTINWTHCKLITGDKCNEWKYCEKLGFYSNKIEKVLVGTYAIGGRL